MPGSQEVRGSNPLRSTLIRKGNEALLHVDARASFWVCLRRCQTGILSAGPEEPLLRISAKSWKLYQLIQSNYLKIVWFSYFRWLFSFSDNAIPQVLSPMKVRPDRTFRSPKFLRAGRIGFQENKKGVRSKNLDPEPLFSMCTLIKRPPSLSARPPKPLYRGRFFVEFV
jgi:hypothetical protein